VKANVDENGDLGGFVAEAQRRVAEKVQMPPGRYHIAWSGKFEHLESGRRRLWLVGGGALGLIFVLLYMTYGNIVDPLRVVTAIPFAAVGGLFALWLRDMRFSIAAGIGFIAMSGVAMLDYMILASYIRQLRRKGVPRDEAVRRAAITRLRPVLMTTLVASLGFLPMALSTGVGAEVQRPLATVVIGGVISAMLMSLLVIRVLYVLFDWVAEFLRWLLGLAFGIEPGQLSWLLGEHYEEKTEPAAADGRPAREAITASS
jgi:cobalt-zinc-cadmium resistance protein CzcA